MKCNCNPKSNFVCSIKGKCKCKAPYTGTYCDKCEEGYTLSNDNECINSNLTNLSYNDKNTCNNNGYCKIPNSQFNPYDKNLRNPCELLECLLSLFAFICLGFVLLKEN